MIFILKRSTLYGITLYLVLLCTPAFSQPETEAGHSEFFRGYLQAPQGNESCNPCVKDVILALNTLRDRGETLGFNWGDNHPEVAGAGTKNHWQGVQRFSMLDFEVPYLVVTSSHRKRGLTPDGFEEISHPARFAVVEMCSRDSDGLRLRSNRLEYGKLTSAVLPDSRDLIVKSQIITDEYDHPGGIQVIGKYLFVGSDGNIGHSREVALFTLWDMSNPIGPQNLWKNPHWELPQANANSVGISRLEDGRYLMLRALGGARQLEFYILGSDIEINPALYHDGVPWDFWDYNELQSELQNPDGSLDLDWADLGSLFGEAGYQGTNLVTECETGTLYLVASHGRRPSGFGGADYVHAYRLDIPSERPNPEAPGEGVVVTKVAKRKLYPADNSGARQGDLQAAAGAYVGPDNQLYFYATQHGVSGEGAHVRMIEFGPEEPRSEVYSIQEAWVELYEHENIEGRSIILDYVDRNLRDYTDFENIESFDNLASSIIYGIPEGHTLRLYADKFHAGGYVDLQGNGQVERIADLSSFEFSNGERVGKQISSAEWVRLLTTVSEGDNESFGFELYQNYPNPFNAQTIIDFEIYQEGAVNIEVFDIRGHLIRTLVNQRKSPGFYSVGWDGRDDFGSDVASGTYLYRLEMGEFEKIGKLILVR